MPEIPQTNPTEAPRKINLKIILFIVVIAILLIGGGVAVWLLLGQPSTSLTSQTPISTSSAKVSTPSAQIDEAADWKTIRGAISKWQTSEEYKFEFKAPKEFKVTKPYSPINPEYDKYYFGSEGSNITLFAGLMEGPGPLTILHGRADKGVLCSNPLDLQVLAEGYFEVCDTLQIDNREALFLIDVHIGSNLHASACEKNSSLNIVYNLSAETSLYFKPELEVLKEIIEPWDKVPTDEVYTDNEGLRHVCPEDIDYNTVKNNLAAKIKSIRNGEGLSETDNKTLKTLYQMISTFKFLN